MASHSIPNAPFTDPVVISERGMIHVLDYTPTEGERGVPISVRIHFDHTSLDSVFLRLLLGTTAVATDVTEIPGIPYGAWQLAATAPPSTSEKVLVSVQAVDQSDHILDSVVFGEFTYWTHDNQRQQQPKHESANEQLPLHANVTRRRAMTTSELPSPTLSQGSRPRQLSKNQRQIRTNSLLRTKYPPSSKELETLHPQTPKLEIGTPLGNMCTNWTEPEVRAGRRLVRFRKIQDGCRIIVYCEPIRQEDYQDMGSVISCIYRQETHSFYVTSVDIISLLECLSGDEFPVEEKNRIRRNLEGLRPITVAKHKPGFESFFQKIMEFPDPKPRNIEKDLKVFEWGLLGQALEKIISKYTLYTRSPADSTVSLPSNPSPQLLPSQLSYPVDNNIGNLLFSPQEPSYEAASMGSAMPLLSMTAEQASSEYSMPDMASFQPFEGYRTPDFSETEYGSPFSQPNHSVPAPLIGDSSFT